MPAIITNICERDSGARSNEFSNRYKTRKNKASKQKIENNIPSCQAALTNEVTEFPFDEEKEIDIEEFNCYKNDIIFATDRLPSLVELSERSQAVIEFPTDSSTTKKDTLQPLEKLKITQINQNVNLKPENEYLYCNDAEFEKLTKVTLVKDELEAESECPDLDLLVRNVITNEISSVSKREYQEAVDSDSEATDSADEIRDNGYVHGYYYSDKEDLSGMYSIERLTEEQMLKYRENKTASSRFSNCKNKCDNCLESFDHHTYTHHVRKHAKAVGPLICRVCKLGFLRHRDLSRHIAAHYILYKCTKCSFISCLWEVFEYHIRRVHTPKSCVVCHQDFPSKKEYDIHKVVHEKKEDLTCTVCGKVMKSRNYLVTHMRLAHEVTPMLECDICHKKYLGKISLQKHLRVHGNKREEAAYCVECGVQFKSIYSYQNHLRESAKHNFARESKFTCEECGRKLMSFKSYEYHRMSQHVKRKDHMCEKCNLGFYTKWKLRGHIYKVHEGRKYGIHQCNICNNVFKSKSILRDHMNTHTGARPYDCTVCGATFGFKAALYTHNRLKHLKLKRGTQRANKSEVAAVEVTEMAATVR